MIQLPVDMGYCFIRDIIGCLDTAVLDEIDPIHRGEESFPLLDVQRYDKLGKSGQSRAVRKKVADIPVRYDDYIFFIQ